MSIRELLVQHSFSTTARSDAGTLFWGALLSLSAIGSSWALACVTPFAAFAFVSARTLSPKAALLTVGLIWLSNQAIGFLFLNYPITVPCILWGIAMGAASLAATVAAMGVMRTPFSGATGLALGFLTAFGVYEGSLLMIALATGEMGGFTLSIVGGFLRDNALFAAGLLLAYWLVAKTPFSGRVVAQAY